MLPDIQKKDDVVLLVDDFYSRVRGDELIGPIFSGVIGDDWSPHLDKMYRFWETVLLGNLTYQGAPFLPHAGLPLEQQHFDRWLQLFNYTVDLHFAGPVAEDAKQRAGKMALMFLSKIQYLRNHDGFHPLV